VLTYWQRNGEDVKATAAFFRKSVPTIQAFLDYFSLSEEAQKEIDTKGLPATAVKTLAKMPREKQTATVKEMKEKRATKGKAAKVALDKAAKGEAIEAKGKAVSRSLRQSVASELANGKTHGLQGADLTLARGVACVLRRLDGDESALAPWPMLDGIIKKVLAGEVKTVKETKATVKETEA
jgi:hypothetical protein